MTNLVTLLAASAAAHGDRVAVRHDDSTLTYAELDDASARVAALLRDRGVLPGDRVAMTMPNLPCSRSSTTASCGPAASSSR